MRGQAGGCRERGRPAIRMDRTEGFKDFAVKLAAVGRLAGSNDLARRAPAVCGDLGSTEARRMRALEFESGKIGHPLIPGPRFGGSVLLCFHRPLTRLAARGL